MGVVRDGERTRLTSPGVGLFTDAAGKGTVLVPGQRAGFLITLGRAAPLVVPAGVSGAVRSERPEAVHAAVGYGAVLYELEGVEALEAGAQGIGADAGAAGGLHFPAPQSGRYWHRPAPGEPALIAAGQLVGPGTAVGLIEVMKTFTQVAYRPDPARGLPERARVVRLVAGDGAEIAQGAPLFEVEPA